MPSVITVERDYPGLYERFTALGPLLDRAGNGGKGISWNTSREVEALRRLNGEAAGAGQTRGMARIESDIDAAEVILMLAPETNGEVAVKAWEALGVNTGREHTHLAAPKRTRRSGSATSSRSRARSSPHPPGPASNRSTSATTRATRTCTS